MSVVLAGLVCSAVMGLASAAAPGGHPISQATQAALGREAKQLLARPGVAHVGFYGFTVDRSGHVLTEWVVRPAGRASLDRLALATIGKAVLKRLPAGAPPHVQFVIPIAFRRNGSMSSPLAGKPGR